MRLPKRDRRGIRPSGAARRSVGQHRQAADGEARRPPRAGGRRPCRPAPRYPGGRAPAARRSAMPWRRADRYAARAAADAADRAAPRRQTVPRHREQAIGPARCVRTGWRGVPGHGGRQAGAAGDRGLRPGRSFEPMWHAFGTPQVGVAVALANHRPLARRSPSPRLPPGAHCTQNSSPSHRPRHRVSPRARRKPVPAACDHVRTCRRIRTLVPPHRQVSSGPRHRPRRPARCRARPRTSLAGSDRSSPRPAR